MAELGHIVNYRGVSLPFPQCTRLI